MNWIKKVFFFNFWIFFFDKFVLKTWISRRLSYFLGILRGVENIFLLGLPSCPQILFLLNIGFRGISESHKNPIQRKEFYYM